MRFEVKFSIKVEKSNALEKALAEFTDTHSSTEVDASATDLEEYPFGFGTTTYLKATS